MNKVRKQRVLTIALSAFVLIVVFSLVLYAMRQNINLFYTPTDVKNGKASFEQKIKLGGMVVKDSLVRSNNSLEVSFALTDFKNTINVHYTGILPDLFREGQGIVSTGFLMKNNEFSATEVLAKHDENYMPPEVKESLDKNLDA